MKKLDSLRAFLTGYIPALRRAPDKLDMAVSRGHLVSWMTSALGFEYRFTASLVIEDYAGDPDTVFLPLILWVRQNQPELLQNHDLADNQIAYQVDRIDADTVDIAVTLPLTETVRVVPRPDGSGADLIHVDEPGLADSVIDVDPAGALLKTLYANGDLLLPEDDANG